MADRRICMAGQGEAPSDRRALLGRRTLVLTVLACVTGLGFATAASGAVVTVAYYKLGEDDPGATNGGTGAAVTLGRGSAGTVSSPTLDLTRIQSPTYTNAVSSAAATKVGSTLGVTFGGTGAVGSGYTRNSPLTTATNNFGLEAWFKLSSTAGNQLIAVNGNSGGSGYGLITQGTTFQAIYGNVTFIDTGVATDTNWHHFAVVRDNGTTRLYLDGGQVGSTSTSTPNSPLIPSNPGFGIGRNFGDYSGNPNGAAQLSGVVDEVRLFTFTAGQFLTSDLLVNQVPEPGAIGLAGVAALGLLRRRRVAR